MIFPPPVSAFQPGISWATLLCERLFSAELKRLCAGSKPNIDVLSENVAGTGGEKILLIIVGEKKPTLAMMTTRISPRMNRDFLLARRENNRKWNLRLVSGSTETGDDTLNSSFT